MSRQSRRAFLSRLGLGAGAAVLSPFLGRLLANAEGAPLPRRLVLVVEGDTLKPSRVMPPEALANLDRVRRELDPRARPAEAKWSSYTNETALITPGITLTRALEPLAPWRDRVNVVQGLSNKIAGGGHTGNFGSLSSARGTRRSPGGITIDNYIGERLHGEHPFARLALGTAKGDGSRERVYTTTARGPSIKSPTYVSPVASHRLLFGAVASDPTRFALEGDLLDAVLPDVGRARDALGGDERAKLDAYLHSLESLRERRSRIVGLEDVLRAGQPDPTDKYTSPHPLVRLEAQFDLAAAALATGLTDVILIASGTSDDGFAVQYTSFGLDIPAKHGLAHGTGYAGMPPSHWLTEVHHRHSLMIAGLIEKLDAIPEGDGTMWDNTLVVYTCDGGEQHHANFADWASVTISGSNVPITTAPGGRSVIYPRFGSERHRQMSNFWNTLCHAMCVPEDDFGGEEAAGLRYAAGPLPELLAP